MSKKRRFFDKVVEFIDKEQKWSIVIFISFLFITFLGIPILVTKVVGFIEFNSDTASIADTINGTTAPLIALIASFLTFIAFWVQYKANQQQRGDLKTERFENKFFEMLKLHKDNVNEMVIDGYDISKRFTKKQHPNNAFKIQNEVETEQVDKNITGRKVFVTTYAEFKACYEICKYTLNFDNFPNKEEYIILMAYSFLYWGVNSDLVTEIDDKIPEDKEYVKKCKVQLNRARNQHSQSIGENNVYDIPESNLKVNLYIKYKPFSGHMSRFGHYYRHLFLMVKYVVEQDKDFLDYFQKREYLKILRAQLSDYEQLMLYFNFLSGFGEDWENGKNKFFSDYRMIHNLPLKLTDFTISPLTKFKKQIEEISNDGEEMFEFAER